MFKGMGFQYAGLLLALLTLIMAPIPFYLFARGAGIRARSDYASATTGALPSRKHVGSMDQAALSSPAAKKAHVDKHTLDKHNAEKV